MRLFIGSADLAYCDSEISHQISIKFAAEYTNWKVLQEFYIRLNRSHFETDSLTFKYLI
jgi:hypothetical protein